MDLHFPDYFGGENTLLIDQEALFITICITEAKLSICYAQNGFIVQNIFII